MRHARIPFLLILSLVTAPAVASAERIKATLIGYEEVPAVSTVASGEFSAKIDNNNQSIDYELTYSGLQGTVTQAHIHVAQLSVNGSIVIWLCGTATNPGPAGTQTCPQSGTITGQITAANVVAGATASQQLATGELAEVIAAIRAGAAYANVHTNLANASVGARRTRRAECSALLALPGAAAHGAAQEVVGGPAALAVARDRRGAAKDAKLLAGSADLAADLAAR